MWHTEVIRQVPWPALESRQCELVAARRSGEDGAWLLVSEPTPTYTFGRFAGRTDLLWNDDELARRGIEVHGVSRGGKWTYHGPGQILVYPIVRLADLGYERHAAHRFVSDLRRGVMDFLTELGISPEPRDKPFGVYVGGRKIASFGVAFERGISSHGVALYYSPQEGRFQGIHPCGVPGEQFTSLAEQLGERLPAWNDAANSLTESVKKVFNRFES